MDDELTALREKCFAAELVMLALTLPLLRVLSEGLSASLLYDVRTTLPTLVADDAPFDRARVAIYVGQIADQIETNLAMERARLCPN